MRAGLRVVRKAYKRVDGVAGSRVVMREGSMVPPMVGLRVK